MPAANPLLSERRIDALIRYMASSTFPSQVIDAAMADPIFLTKSGKPLTRRTVREVYYPKAIKRWSEYVGRPKQEHLDDISLRLAECVRLAMEKGHLSTAVKALEVQARLFGPFGEADAKNNSRQTALDTLENLFGLRPNDVNAAATKAKVVRKRNRFGRFDSELGIETDN